MVAWKVAREVCASLKQSQLMRLFVSENLPMVEPARLLSFFWIVAWIRLWSGVIP